MPKSLFLSHSHVDHDFAIKLASDLKKTGAQIWIDEAEIKLGDSLIKKIREGIDSVDYLAVVLSPDSVNSEWVQREVEIAMTQEIKGRIVKVLPLMYRQCELPGFLVGKLYADFTEEYKYQSSLKLILERLDINLGGAKFDKLLFERCLSLFSSTDNKTALELYHKGNFADLMYWIFDNLILDNHFPYSSELFLILGDLIANLRDNSIPLNSNIDKIIAKSLSQVQDFFLNIDCFEEYFNNGSHKLEIRSIATYNRHGDQHQFDNIQTIAQFLIKCGRFQYEVMDFYLFSRALLLTEKNLRKLAFAKYGCITPSDLSDWFLENIKLCPDEHCSYTITTERMNFFIELISIMTNVTPNISGLRAQVLDELQNGDFAWRYDGTDHLIMRKGVLNGLKDAIERKYAFS